MNINRCTRKYQGNMLKVFSIKNDYEAQPWNQITINEEDCNNSTVTDWYITFSAI